MRRAAGVGCLLVLALFVLAVGYTLHEVFAIGKPSTVWNQKITVAVDGPSGPVSASSVTQMRIVPSGMLTGDGRRFNIYLRGEAVVLDTGAAGGGPRYLFALLRQYDRVRTKGEPMILTPDRYPLLVTFADIADPASVKRVDPYDLAASFGPGYALKSVTLEVTDEAATQGRMEQVLGWLGEHPEPSVIPDVKPTDFSFEAKLRHGDFIRRQQ